MSCSAIIPRRIDILQGCLRRVRLPIVGEMVCEEASADGAQRPAHDPAGHRPERDPARVALALHDAPLDRSRLVRCGGARLNRAQERALRVETLRQRSERVRT